MKNNKKKIIIAAGIAVVLIIILLLVIFLGKKDVTRLSIEMGSPNEGVIIDDPVLGMSNELKVGKKIKLISTIYPENHKNVTTEYVVAYVNDDNMIVAKSAGTTSVYLRTTMGKEIKSNKIEITVHE